MKIKQYLLGIFLILFFLTTIGRDSSDLAALKKRLISYHDSGEYYHQIDSVVKEAVYYLQFRLNQNNRLKKPIKLAIVLDIDETALSNYADMMHRDFSDMLEEVDTIEKWKQVSAIPGIYALYHYALQHHITVFFITDRKENQREVTIKSLKTVGYDHWGGLLMKPIEYRLLSVSTFKTSMRKKIINEGYDIILNIGDQVSDVAGGYADMHFKLPNPYYRVD